MGNKMLGWFSAISFGDVLVALCTGLSPLIAIRVNKFIEGKVNLKKEQVAIFKTLMCTRSEPLDRRHVEALNSIDIVFSEKDGQEKTIRSNWKAYLNILGKPPFENSDPTSWLSEKSNTFKTLMSSMATYLGYDFDPTDIENQAYLPRGYSDYSKTQTDAQQALLKILTGAAPLQIKVIPQESITPPNEK